MHTIDPAVRAAEEDVIANRWAIAASVVLAIGVLVWLAAVIFQI